MVRLVVLILIVLLASEGDAMSGVSFDGRRVLLDGEVLNPGSRAEGLLMNSRMIQGAIEDYNASTRSKWAYPTGPWSAERNVSELIANLDDYAAYGLNMVTVGMQGGHPRFRCSDDGGVGARNFSMFTPDGELRVDAADRLRRVIVAADEVGLIVNVQLFYQNQDNRLSGNAAVLKATSQAATFLRSIGSGNILVEIANEVSVTNYKHTALQPSAIDDRIMQVRSIWPEALVSVSMNSDGRLGPTAVRQAVDWVSFHANSESVSGMVGIIRKAHADPNLRDKPIAVTEDLWDQGTAPMDAAVNEGAGWGFYRQGCEQTGSYTGAARYRDGFQSLPVNWTVGSDPTKVAFFDRVKTLTT